MRIAALLLALALSCSEEPAPKGFATGEGFLWGSATAAYQVEGGNHVSDWYQFERAGKVQGGARADDGPDHWAHYAADFQEARAMGHNAYRMSIEWAKIEPTRGRYDLQVLGHYRAMLLALKAWSIRPMVTLHHFTFPIWVQNYDAESAGLGGWGGRPGEGDADAQVVREFARFAGDMAAQFGDLVDLWCTVNEPMVLVAGGYLAGRHPPGHLLDIAGAARATVHIIYAHAAAYDAIHARDLIDADGDGKAALVGTANHLRVIDPHNAEDPKDVEGAAQLEQIFNWGLVDGTVFGHLDVNLDGDYEDAGEGRDLAAIRGRADYVGINYYTRSVVIGARFVSPDGSVIIKGFPLEGDDPLRERTDMDWEVYPEGFYKVLTESAQRYRLPIYVTENGIADENDDQRARYIVRHLAAMQEAMRDGADVRGYFYWSLIDNFEWDYGFRPRLGLLRVDYGSPARTRSRTRGAAAYSAVIAARGVTPALLVQFGQ